LVRRGLLAVPAVRQLEISERSRTRENVRQDRDLLEVREPKRRMRRSEQNICVRLGAIAALTVCSSIFLPTCSTTPGSSPVVSRAVLMWLKHPDSSADRAQLMRAAHSLRMIPGVLRVDVSRVVPALPPDMDKSFDLGVVITFRDRAALERFKNSRRRHEAVRRYLRPLVERYVICDLSSR
jgi:hypothetical protein